MTFNDTGNCLLVSDELTDSSDATLEMTLLPADYILADSDVLCGRGKKCFKHVGNEIFRTMVQESLRSYAVAPTKTEKTFIIRAVINRVRARSPNGGFVKHDPLTGRYYEVGETMAVSKCRKIVIQDVFHQVSNCSLYVLSSTARENVSSFQRCFVRHVQVKLCS